MKDQKPELEKFEKFTEKGRRQIAEICHSAARVFYEKGYLSATLADVAAVAGITKGAIFHYFSTKEELLFLTLYRYHELSLNDMKNALGACRDPRKKLFAYINTLVMSHKDRRAEFYLALNEREHLLQNYLEIIKGQEKEVVNILKSLVEDLLGEEKKDSKRVTLLAYSLLGMCAWPSRWFVPGGGSSTEELSRTIYEIFVGDTKLSTPHADQIASRSKDKNKIHGTAD